MPSAVRVTGPKDELRYRRAMSRCHSIWSAPTERSGDGAWILGRASPDPVATARGSDTIQSTVVGFALPAHSKKRDSGTRVPLPRDQMMMFGVAYTS